MYSDAAAFDVMLACLRDDAAEAGRLLEQEAVDPESLYRKPPGIACAPRFSR